MKKVFAYICNWRSGPNQCREECADERLTRTGLSTCEFDSATGELTFLSSQQSDVRFGGGCVDAERGILYCADETPDYPGLPGGGGGQILAFSVDGETGEAVEIGRRPSYGSLPSSLCLDGEGKYLLATNYGFRTYMTRTTQDAFGKYHIEVVYPESSLVLFPLLENGAPGEPADIQRLTGSGPKSFQLSSHAHCVRKAPGKNLYAVCDKGGDRVLMYRIDYEKGKLVLCEGGPYFSTPGAAPRIAVFHPTLPCLYVNMEDETLINVYRYDGEGRLTLLDCLDTQPEGYAPPEDLGQSDMCMDASGRFLYVLLRCVNVISVFAVDEETGLLRRVQTLDVENGPRGCNLSPDGRFLTVAYYASRQVCSYPVLSDGTLGEKTSSLHQPTPSAVLFMTP